MLRARKLIDAHVPWNIDVLPSTRIDGVESAGRFPVLCVTHRVDDLRARVGWLAPIEQAAFLPGKGVEGLAIRERTLRARILLLRVLRPRQPARLRESHVDVVAHRADMRLHAVEDPAELFILVKAKLQKGSEQAPALRDAVQQRPLDLAGQRILS